ncbi:MAG: hypothetical protein A4E55_01683 [Pelotomaculum sp. PtaU1.Bin035]|nr:MAG: hypothetical protein A4E55_01683 [Pelotomaculum sp. PtaU1.Bin035]
MLVKAVNVALTVYGIGFIIGFFIAFLMKGMSVVLKTK